MLNFVKTKIYMVVMDKLIKQRGKRNVQADEANNANIDHSVTVTSEYSKVLKRNLKDGMVRNQSEFESKITLIGSGAIALSLAFIAEKENLCCLLLFYVAISFLVISLFVNLYSVLIASDFGLIALRETNKNKEFPSKKIKKMNDCSRACNWTSFIGLILGIVAIALFVIININ